MKRHSLSTKLFIVSVLALVVLCLASFGVLYRAQTQLAVQEMDTLVSNQILALSALVSAQPGGRFDFEISPAFHSHYERLQPVGFFRFIGTKDGKVLRESLGAPALDCGLDWHLGADVSVGEGRIFRVKSSQFRPEIDSELESPAAFEPAEICLVVGVDEAPYRSLVIKTVLSTIPLLAGLVVLLIGALLFLVRRLTRDLSRLTSVLATADFGATHEFPSLPETHTLEVKAVVDKLESLHQQVSSAYREMWLFQGRAAHQLKTPIAAMQATVQVLLRKERNKEELLAGLVDVESATVILAGLVKKLLSSSRLSYQEALDRESMDIEVFFEEEFRMFRAQAEQAGVLLKLEIMTDVRVLGNSFLLYELFGNLIENAILYSPAGKRSTVWVKVMDRGQEIVVTILDEGSGFPDQVKASLFEPFTRGDERSIPGSGLGLSIVRKAAQLLGGEVELRRSDASGSEIRVTLPLAVEKEAEQ